MTAIPIIETQAGDISAYIPTNVVSITDGQIYLESDLFYSGVRPAVNVGLSVSRVGGKAQEKAMRQVASQLRLDLAQYRELVAFTQFGSEIDKTAQLQLTRGERMVQVLRQDQFATLSLAKQVMIIYAGTKGFLDDIPVASIRSFEKMFYAFVAKERTLIEEAISREKVLSDALKSELDTAIRDFKAIFMRMLKT